MAWRTTACPKCPVAPRTKMRMVYTPGNSQPPSASEVTR
jgi:hypothetical protein